MNINTGMRIASNNIKSLHFGELQDEGEVNNKYYNRINSTLYEADRHRFIAKEEHDEGFISTRKYKKELKKIDKWERKRLDNIHYEDTLPNRPRKTEEKNPGIITRLLNIFK